MPVEVVYTPGNALETLKTFIAPIAGPLGTAAIVVVLVIFMLLEREDLRDRMIHLIGRGRLHVTTQAIDEAGGRVSRYLVAQCIVNVTYGIPIGIGLWLIGMPNAVLWGMLAAHAPLCALHRPVDRGRLSARRSRSPSRPRGMRRCSRSRSSSSWN